MKAVSLWSGGKDSTFACDKAIKEGHQIVSLVNLLHDDGAHSLSHGISKEIINIQARSVGLSLVQREMAWKAYREQFISLMRNFKKINGIEGIVFGDIYLEAHKEWIEDVCSEIEVKAIMPLWGINTEKLAGEFIDLGFEAIIVAANNKFMGPEFLGRKFDHNLIDELIKIGIDPCGEEGEFHTFVYNGPIFNEMFNFSMIRKRFSDNHWFLDLN
ncbi:MAG: ATP pyrophosphatase [bacterium]|nr:MAG: ATP pyrophosphatase [bacterium]